MSARSKARKRALDMLYAADLRGVPAIEVLDQEAVRARTQPEREASWAYGREIVLGVIERSGEIDETIASHARGWTLERMPATDRAILRIAVWEILFNDEVPDSVAIAEAVESATVLSTDDSAGFINGVLGAVAASR
ncbi:transcription antitermination factor NusB [Arenivirga flava]|uniref:Transcription antitermination protein NusB n=1 Tax=Arenivirga flava TaxID=1930060 RepID=A0AA37XAR5_9MICO|nr:transcription antitermination factor NusB [Arenivirga flava]GMA27601.1 N utilization substance protein B [Arenivirga flava]